MDKCNWPMCNNLTDKKFCSYSCKNKFFVDRRRKKIKLQAIAFMGGKCFCGYNKCEKAFDFHHLNPEDKDFNLSKDGHTRSWSLIKDEIKKCILVCSNCHREIHAGLHDKDFLIKIQKEQIENGSDLEIVNEVKIKKEVIVKQKISKKPDKELLEKLVWQLPCTKIGEMFGVSDNAVNKWCKSFGISKPPRGYWQKLNKSSAC